MKKPPHEVLGVPPRPTLGELEEARRAKQLETHPDRHPDDPEAAERFQAVQTAYEQLRRELTGEASFFDRVVDQVLEGAAATAAAAAAAAAAAGREALVNQLNDWKVGDFLKRFLP